MLGWLSRVASCASSTNIDRNRREAPCARQDPLENEDLVGALRAQPFGDENFGHAAGARPADDLELAELGGSLGPVSLST